MKPAKSILVVDDSEMARNFLSYVLKMAGYEVETGENGVVALEKILKKRYDLLITDINMPKMDGYELINHLCELGIFIPVIVLSVENEGSIKTLNIKNRLSMHMVKPADPEVLVKTIKGLL